MYYRTKAIKEVIKMSKLVEQGRFIREMLPWNISEEVWEPYVIGRIDALCDFFNITENEIS